ncbi:MAG TPA: cytochrome c4 [Steroidobacteraceae bacterium]|nr:cytochrome c4 [Steroidobacteraceae bacterium]
MRSRTSNWVIIAAIAVGALCAREAAAADPLVPHDQSVYDAKTLISMACSKCHGLNGVSISPLFPILAAQQASYIEMELQLFRQRARSDPHARAFMWGIAQRLDDDQIEALAQYFSSQPPARGRASRNPALAAKGKSIYENGVPERDILGCIGCHGPNAEGIHTFPRLAGQHRDYLAIQLRQFNGRPLRDSEIMHRFTENITEDEIAAVTEYLASK